MRGTPKVKIIHVLFLLGTSENVYAIAETEDMPQIPHLWCGNQSRSISDKNTYWRPLMYDPSKVGEGCQAAIRLHGDFAFTDEVLGGK